MKLGCVNVDAMLRSLTSVQLLEWQRYSELEPFDEMRMDYRIAAISQAIYNMNRDTKKHPDGFPITDFLLAFGDSKPPAPPKKDWQQMKETARMIAEAYADGS